MDIVKIIQTLTMIGSEFPAYVALFEQVKAQFEESDREKLDLAYAEAQAASDTQHSEAQNL